MLSLFDWKGVITSVLLLWNFYQGLPVSVGSFSINADMDYCTAAFSAVYRLSEYLLGRIWGYSKPVTVHFILHRPQERRKTVC